MTIIKASAEDAIQIYILVIAYLHDARIGTPRPASTWLARERQAEVFHIWRCEQSSIEDEPLVPAAPTTPVAVVTHKKGTKLWKIKLSSGEELTLLDKGNTWDIVWDANLTPLIFVKKSKPPRGSRRNKRA